MFYFKECICPQKAIIIQNGSLSDCVRSLPLAVFLKDTLAIDRIDFIGLGENISFMPGRTAVSNIKNIRSLGIERLFAPAEVFEIAEDEPLVRLFEGANWIISFLGGSGSDFEANLVYLACCTSSPEIVMLPNVANENCRGHISSFHIEQLIEMKQPSIEAAGVQEAHKKIKPPVSLICPNINDINLGLAILRDMAAIDILRDNIAIICPSVEDNRGYWHIENYICTAEKMRAEGFEPVFLFGATARGFDDVVCNRFSRIAPVLSGLPIEQIVAVLSVCKVYIGADSGISHISGAMELPTITISSEDVSEFYKPTGLSTVSMKISREAHGAFDEKSVDMIITAALETISSAAIPLYNVFI